MGASPSSMLTQLLCSAVRPAASQPCCWLRHQVLTSLMHVLPQATRPVTWQLFSRTRGECQGQMGSGLILYFVGIKKSLFQKILKAERTDLGWFNFPRQSFPGDAGVR